MSGNRMKIVSAAIGETTAHGLARTVKGRHVLARVAWALAFVGWFSYFTSQLINSVSKLQSKPTSTSIEPNSVNFQLPQIHICPDPIISPSYSAVMTDDQKSIVNDTIYKIENLLKSLPNIETTNFLVSRLLANTLSHSFISDFMAQRKEQNLIGAVIQPGNENLELNQNITDLYHHKYINCFTLTVDSEYVNRLLNSGIGFIDIVLFSDATYKTNQRFYGGSIDVRGINLKDYEPLISSGFTIYFTSKGQYPDDQTKLIKVNPGFMHHISLKMFRTELAPAKKACNNDMENVQLMNFKRNLSESFKYNLGMCYTKKLNEQFSHDLKCYLPGYAPILFENRNLKNCLNLTEYLLRPNNLTSEEKLRIAGYINISVRVPRDVTNSLTEKLSFCKNQKPCIDEQYLVDSSSVLFPIDVKSPEMGVIFRALTESRENKNFSVPGRRWVMELYDTATGNASTAEADEKLLRAVRENILRIRLTASESMSTKYVQAINFIMADLMANVGGLMGLFLGCSVMTLLEIIELIICLIVGRHSTWNQAVGSPDANLAKVSDSAAIAAFSVAPEGDNNSQKLENFNVDTITK